MSRGALRTLVVVWTMLCGALFVTLLTLPETGDVAGFVIAMLVLQAPAFAALADAPEGVPLSPGRSIAIAIPAALVGAFAALFVFGTAADLVLRHGDSLYAVLVAFVAALFGFVASGLVVGVYLCRRAHPHGARRVLSWFAIASGLGAAFVLVAGHRVDVALAVVVATPFAWALPLLAATHRKPADPVPMARVARIAR